MFNAPAINPFSNHAIDVLGQSVLTRIRRQLLARHGRYRAAGRLCIKLPANAITPELQQETTAAVGRYVDAKIADNKLTMRLSRRLGLLGLLLAIAISVGVLALNSLLLAGPLVTISEDARGLIVAFVGILAWVMLWDPLSTLLFAWIEPWLENRVLRTIRSMSITIEPQDER